jgi:serine palmitoyltransferase
MVAHARKGLTPYANGTLSVNGYTKTHSRCPSADVSFDALTSPPEKDEKRSVKEFRDDVESREEVSLSAAFLTYFSYGLLTVVGYVLEGLAKLGWGGHGLLLDPRAKEGIAPLYANFESFFTRHIYRRIRDCWNRPICSVPGVRVTLKDRYTPDNGWTFKWTGTTTECINMASYNYLGFAENTGPCCEEATKAIRDESLTLGSPIRDLGVGRAVKELESLVAEYFGVDDSIVFGMGFATNSLNLPSLVTKGCLIISDQWNHASLILGSRLSGASIRVFKHNNMASLEKVLKDSIVHGQPRTKRPWKKILIVVEGIYSMEGTIVL